MRTSRARILRVPPPGAAWRLTCFCGLTVLVACSQDVDVERERDELASITAPELPGAVVGCEVAVSMRTVSWVWKWDWDPASRTLKTSGENPWTLRYDPAGRLISDDRPADKLRVDYAYEPNAVVGRRVYLNGQVEPDLSFEQRVSAMSTQRTVESRGRTLSGTERVERVHYDDIGFSVESVENGSSIRLNYATSGRWLTSTRENGSTVSCTYARGVELASCVEDGTFNPLHPSEGAAADGTTDVEWRFSPACAALYPIATIPWLSLPVVAPLSECLWATPPHRSPDRCRSFFVKWTSNEPALVTGESMATQQSRFSWDPCGESPCWMQRHNVFRFVARERPAMFHCTSTAGTTYDSPEPTLEFDLGTITSDWTCEVSFAPRHHVVRWESNVPSRVLGWFGSTPTAPTFDQRCAASPCQVPAGSWFAFNTSGKMPAHFHCVAGTTGQTREERTDELQLGRLSSDWTCRVTFDPPQTYTVNWRANLPQRIQPWVTQSATSAQWERCWTTSCQVREDHGFALLTTGKIPALFQCVETRTGRRREGRTGDFRLGAVTSNWDCEVTVDAPPRYRIVWQSNMPDKIQDFRKQVGATSFARCTGSPCWVDAYDEFVFWTSREGELAQFTCVEQKTGARRSARTAELRLGQILNNWDCTVAFDQPPPPTSPPVSRSPTAPPPQVVTFQWQVQWEARAMGVPTNDVRVNGVGLGRCGAQSCGVNHGGSVTLTAPAGYATYSFECRDGGNNVLRSSEPQITLTSIRANWKCKLEMSVVI